MNCLVIAEVAQAHDGSLGTAHAFIDAVAAAGADAIKFQTHIAAAESSPSEPWRIKFSYQDVTRYDYWKRMEFSEVQWAGLKEHAEQKNLQFLSSPFSIEAVMLLQRIGVKAWKIASGEVSNYRLIDSVAETGLPVFLSSGMSDYRELDSAVARIRRGGNDLTVFQCTSAYPCPPEKVGLNQIRVIRDRYRCKVGLSDHSGTIYPGLAAVALGLDALEVHVTLSREMFGPDVCSSITTADLRQLIEGVRFIERMNANPVDKNQAAEELRPMKRLFSKSIVAARDIARGTVLQESDLALRKPGHGIPIERIPEVIGRKLRRDLSCGELLGEPDFETTTL